LNVFRYVSLNCESGTEPSALDVITLIPIDTFQAESEISAERNAVVQRLSGDRRRYGNARINR